MPLPARRQEAIRFVGQVYEHLTPNALTVWALDAGIAYRCFSTVSAEFPVGTVVECTLSPHGDYIEHLHRADERTYEEYRRKLVI